MMKMSTFLFLSTLLCILSVAPPATRAQNAGVKVYTQAQLLEMERQLREKEDKSKGVGSLSLETYDTRRTILGTRDKDGQSEMHAHVSDFFVVVEGEATLVFGGTMVNPKLGANGESLGDSVKDGQQEKLAKGDVVQIPPNIPHQLLVAPGKTFTYFVIKFKEPS
jgi:mannose-6-phosphate isomerase-like protein (cupin superfamily)